MSNAGTILTFMVVAFAFALVLIMKKDSVPQRLKKGLAIFALIMVCSAFILVVYSFFQVQ